jgi:hypothetical protein
VLQNIAITIKPSPHLPFPYAICHSLQIVPLTTEMNCALRMVTNNLTNSLQTTDFLARFMNLASCLTGATFRAVLCLVEMVRRCWINLVMHRINALKKIMITRFILATYFEHACYSLSLSLSRSLSIYLSLSLSRTDTFNRFLNRIIFLISPCIRALFLISPTHSYLFSLFILFLFPSTLTVRHVVYFQVTFKQLIHHTHTLLFATTF